ncbi:MAG TPA: hypothetical protein VGP02_00095 [Mycobacteriales bacterium]|nr:hypothetical protein [Mycobacteriales bacterium]
MTVFVCEGKGLYVAGFEVRGEWWLPGDEQHTVPGILVFEPTQGSTLSLLGALRDIHHGAERTVKDGVTTIKVTQASLDTAGVYPRVHGVVGGKAYTLEDCFREKIDMNLFSGAGQETIHVNRVLRGAWFGADEPLHATAVTLQLAFLEDWIGESGITEVIPEVSSTSGAPAYALESRVLPTRTASIYDGRTLSLSHRVGLSGTVLSARSLTQEFYWRVEGQNSSIDDLVEIASDIQDLVSIATNQTASFRSLQFSRPEVHHKLPSGKKIEEPIEMFASWRTGEPGERRRSLMDPSLLFTFDQIGGVDGMGRWMEVAAQHRSALGRVMGSQYATSMFVSDRLMNCAAALEAFDRARFDKKNTKFKTRLVQCAELAGEPFTKMVGNVAKWTEAVRQHRDDVAHHLGKIPNNAHIDTHYLWRSLHWLFILCMLRACAAPDVVFTRLQAHADFLWVSKHVKVAAGSTAG